MHRTSKNLIDACRTQHDNPLFPNSFFVRFFLTPTRQEKKIKIGAPIENNWARQIAKHLRPCEAIFLSAVVKMQMCRV